MIHEDEDEISQQNKCKEYYPCDNVMPDYKNLDAIFWLLGHLNKYYVI
jgi:hypothetical protein